MATKTAKKTSVKKAALKRSSERSGTAKKAAANRVTKKASSRTTKKAASKKVVTRNKKQSKKVVTTKRLPVKKIADPGQCFWVNYGPVVATLDELAEAFHQMSDEQFYHHAGRDDMNDFAQWVRHVFEEPMLARRIARAKTRSGARRVLVAYITLGR